MGERNRYRHVSKAFYRKAGLYGYGYYDPRLQRWLTPEPIGLPGGLKFYGFAGGFTGGRGFSMLRSRVVFRRAGAAHES